MVVEFSNDAGLSTGLNVGSPVDILPTSNITVKRTDVDILTKKHLHLLLE